MRAASTKPDETEARAINGTDELLMRADAFKRGGRRFGLTGGNAKYAE